jgi:hypothetical protein
MLDKLAGIPSYAAWLCWLVLLAGYAVYAVWISKLAKLAGWLAGWQWRLCWMAH